jgi:hypothetical protein
VDFVELALHGVERPCFPVHLDLGAGEGDPFVCAGWTFELDVKLIPLHRHVDCAVAGFRGKWRL